MCGLAGFWDRSGAHDEAALQDLALRMADTLARRGPDDRGAWADAAAGVGLGFRRLAVIDLSAEGHQPMTSASGRYVIVFNGEIYNHQDIRGELGRDATAAFRGRSDTETLLAAVERWGSEAAVSRFDGMFAFALWDRRERRLTLGRDRMGEKPLYYGRVRGRILFGSELKALRAHPEFRGEVDRDVLCLYLRHGYVPAPYAIYRDVRKLPPGTLLTITADDVDRGSDLPEPVAYWSARAAAEAGAREPFSGSPTEAVEELDRRLRQTVAREMAADVPLGAFLSGGIDSSTIVALMQAQSERAIKTFTIGFTEAEFNEAPFAQAVARRLGADHTELYVTPETTRDVIPLLPTLYDEPFADSSAIPTCLISQLARRRVTVSLSGDGGDEVFGGYPWYQRMERIRRRARCVPAPLRGLAARGLRRRASEDWDRALAVARRLLPGAVGRKATGDRAHQLLETLTWSQVPERLHRSFTSLWAEPTALVREAGEPPTAWTTPAAWADVPGVTARMMALDQTTYLPDDILVKVDRASMGVGLESRAPFLDHRLVEFAWRLPPAWLNRDGRSKWPLRQVLERYVPAALFERPKMGFSVPIHAWLRAELRPWADALLSEDRLRRDGLFHPEPVQRCWREHLAGDRDWSGRLWSLLMFQAWADST